MPPLGPRWMFRCGRGRSPGGRPWWKGWSSLQNAKEMRHWCMSQQNVVGSYQHATEFWRAGPQDSLADGEEAEFTLSLLFNRFLFKVLNSFVMWLLNGDSLGGPSGFCLLMATEQQCSASWIEQAQMTFAPLIDSVVSGLFSQRAMPNSETHFCWWASMEDLIISRSSRALLASSQRWATSGGGVSLAGP